MRRAKFYEAFCNRNSSNEYGAVFAYKTAYIIRRRSAINCYLNNMPVLLNFILRRQQSVLGLNFRDSARQGHAC